MSSTNLEQNQGFFRRWAKTYDNPFFQFWMKRFYRPVVDFVSSEAVSGKRKLTVLDVSCGTGELLSALAHQDKNGNLALGGIDLTEEMITKAGKKLPPDVLLRTADVHNLPFADNTFDLVTSTEAFHHYEHQLKALQEMKRVAKLGARVIIVDVNFFLPLAHYLFAKCEPGCVKINSRREMRALFRAAWLSVIKQRRVFLFAVMTVAIKENRE